MTAAATRTSDRWPTLQAFDVDDEIALWLWTYRVWNGWRHPRARDGGSLRSMPSLLDLIPKGHPPSTSFKFITERPRETTKVPLVGEPIIVAIWTCLPELHYCSAAERGVRHHGCPRAPFIDADFGDEDPGT